MSVSLRTITRFLPLPTSGRHADRSSRDLLACLHQQRRCDFALRSQGGQLPVQHVARATCFITEPQLFNRFQFSNQPSNGLRPIGIRPKDRTSPFGSATATAIVSAWTSRPTIRILCIGPTLLSLAALRR